MYFTKLIQGTLALCVFNLPIAAAEATINFEGTPKLQKDSLNWTIWGEKSPITEVTIRQSLEEMAAAANNRDIDRLLGFYSPNYSGEVTITTATGPETIQVTREESRERLQLSYQTTEKYNFSYSLQEITISNDGKTAKVIGTSNEDFNLQGQDYRSTSAWVINFELIDGKILIVSDTSTLLDLEEL